jgi:hypothetical protein
LRNHSESPRRYAGSRPSETFFLILAGSRITVRLPEVSGALGDSEMDEICEIIN